MWGSSLFGGYAAVAGKVFEEEGEKES